MAELFENDRPGVLVTLEGVDGSGKTTQLEFLAQALNESGRECLCLREPGGTAISEQVRQLLLDPANDGMAAETELLLYEAARAQLVREVIEPALERGVVVLCDRFYDSTFAYQASARGLDEDLVRKANDIGSCGLKPTRTLVLDIDPREAYVRAVEGGADRMESEGINFQQRVRAGYVRATELEDERIRLVDATGEVADVFMRLIEELDDVIPELKEFDSHGFLAVQHDVERAFAEVAAAAKANAELFGTSPFATETLTVEDDAVAKADAAVAAVAANEEQQLLEAAEAERARAEAEAAARAEAEAEAEAERMRQEVEEAARAKAEAEAEAAARAQAEAEAAARAQAEAARAAAEAAAAARARAVAEEEAELFAQIQASVAAEARRLSSLDTQAFAKDALDAESDAMASLDVLPSSR